MSFLHGLLQNYAQFFSWPALSAVISSPDSWAIIASLILLEGLLSVDNAIVLAIVVNHLPEKQKKKALLYGIWGAYIFRFIAIGLGTFLVKFQIIKIAGAAYLLWMSFKYFFLGGEGDEDETPTAKRVSFWGTILTVELMDIAFSMDSILASFGVSTKPWVLLIGGMLGILAMRCIAQLFVSLLEKFPEYNATAYILIALAGLKLLGSAFGFVLGDTTFFAIMMAIFFGTMAVHYFRPKTATEENHKKAA